MLLLGFTCVALIAATTVIHYEVLSALNAFLPRLRIPNHLKLLLVIFGTFFAHGLEIGLYGLSLFALVEYAGIGSLTGAVDASLANCLYLSAQTYTTLGFGDLTPAGPLRLIAGIESLNGLLLIGWSASYAYIAMTQFWSSGPGTPQR